MDNTKKQHWFEQLATGIIKKDFVMDEHNTPLIKNLFYYFRNNVLFSGDLEKGLIVRGEYGTGKTLIMRAYAKYTNWHKLDKKFIVFSVGEIQKMFIEHGYPGVNIFFDNIITNQFDVKNATPLHVCIDDFGATKTITRYGTEINIVNEIISRRYELFTHQQIITHLTTNFSDLDFIESLSARELDRFREMPD